MGLKGDFTELPLPDLIEMTALLDPALPEVATAIESGRVILGRLGA